MYPRWKRVLLFTAGLVAVAVGMINKPEQSVAGTDDGKVRQICAPTHEAEWEC